jgi:chloride channel 7
MEPPGTEEPLLGADTAYAAMGDNGIATAGSGEGMRRRVMSQTGVLHDIARADITENEAQQFFAWGRDFESINTPHKFLAAEKVAMAKFEANNYFSQNSEVYRTELERQDAAGNTKNSRSRWLAMGLIGFIVAIISFVVRQTVDVISTGKYTIIEPLIDQGHWGYAWLAGTMYSCFFVAVSASMVLFIAPAAASSGIPEVIAFLNGVHIPKIFNVKTLGVKLLGVICSVGSGLPVGPEGPMIHMGGMIGAGVSQGRSATMGFEMGLFDDFRNVKDRRDFTTCGVACGVSAAFGSPVGGLLFAMEEVASFWSQRLGWMIFFGCMVAVFVSDVLNSAFEGYDYVGHFGAFNDKNSILYKVTYDVSLHVLALVPAVLCGVFGGVLGTAFTIFNMKVARMRKSKIAPSQSKRFLEVMMIMIIYSTISLLLPAAWKCRTVEDCSFVQFDTDIAGEPPDEGEFYYRCGTTGPNGGYEYIPNSVKSFTCDGVTRVEPTAGGLATDTAPTYKISYNEMATLITTTGEDTIHKLFTRGTSTLFSYKSLFTMLVIYFIAACYTMGSVVAAGVVVPMLLIGGCYGRIVGKICIDIAGGAYARGTIWAWIDPGVFALIGVGSFFGGVSRLTLSLTVIMIEISNDIHMLLVMMSTIMVAKWIADYYTHSLYHSLIELKCMPFINDEIPSHSNMDRYLVKDIMQGPVVTIPEIARVDDVRNLFDLTHNGFPVVQETADGSVMKGMILKETLLELLRHSDLFYTADQQPPTRRVPYTKIKDTEVSQKFQSQHTAAELKKINPYGDYADADPDSEEAGRNYSATEEVLRRTGDGLLMDLRPYVDESAFKVSHSTSVERSYLLFRSMGLRHLPIVDEYNHAVGILTRKDIQGHDIAHALEHHDDDHGHH